MKKMSSFNQFDFPPDLVADIARLNPWWEGNPLPDLPLTQRHLVATIRNRIEKNLAPIIVVRGPRQIGKTTSQLQLIQKYLNSGVDPKRIIRIQFDDLQSIRRIADKDPILRIADWYEKNVLRKTLNESARNNGKVFFFLDEAQNLDNWAPQLKSLVDNSTVSVVVTGSSAMRIEMGRDSLAGRISTIECGTLSITEIAQFNAINISKPFLTENGLDILTNKNFWTDLRKYGESIKDKRDFAFKIFSQRGSYPLAHKNINIPWTEIADQLNETVVQRVIQHDLRLGEKGRKRDSALLEEIFRMACRYAGQSPSFTLFAREAQRVLNANIGAQRVNHYLKFLANALLLKLVNPLEIRLKKKKGYPKICLIDHSLRASWLQENVPLEPDELTQNPHLSVVAGRIAESVVGITLSTIFGLDISHLPARGNDPEVDFILTLGTKRVPIEVRYQKIIDRFSDTECLRTFIEKSANNAVFGILITQTDTAEVDDPRIVTLPLSSFMLLK